VNGYDQASPPSGVLSAQSHGGLHHNNLTLIGSDRRSGSRLVDICQSRLPPHVKIISRTCLVSGFWRSNLMSRDTPPDAPFARGGNGLPSERAGVGGGLGIGLVGPMTNYAAPPQFIEDVPYRDLVQMHAFARNWREEHRGQWFTVPKFSGFCLLMKRDVYEVIGGLDEQFGLGLFDDDDLAIRARQAGFELAVAHDLFIHDFGGRTFAGKFASVDQGIYGHGTVPPPRSSHQRNRFRSSIIAVSAGTR